MPSVAHTPVLQAPGQVLLGSGRTFMMRPRGWPSHYRWCAPEGLRELWYTASLLWELFVVGFCFVLFFSHTFCTTSMQVKTTELTHHGLDLQTGGRSELFCLYNSAVTEMCDSKRKLTDPSRFQPSIQRRKSPALSWTWLQPSDKSKGLTSIIQNPKHAWMRTTTQAFNFKGRQTWRSTAVPL